MKHRSTILIADDEPAGRETLEGLLISQDYTLVFASDGPETLSQAAKLLPDVILLDVMMPGMDGFQVCREIRADPKLAEVPIIMVTALDDKDSRLRGIEAGADEFVSKPFDRAELRARVRMVAQLNRYRRLLSEQIKFEWVVEHAGDGYLLLNDDDEVLYANPQARLLLGLPFGEDISETETFLKLTRREYGRVPQGAWSKWPDAGDDHPPRYLLRPESPDAEAVWLQVHMLELPTTLSGRWLVRLRDATAQINVQRDMWTFHSMISHKLRSPMAGVLGGLDMLTQSTSKVSSTVAAEFANMALEKAQQLRDEIIDVLGYIDAPVLEMSSLGLDISQLRVIIDEISTDLGLESVNVSIQDELIDTRLLFSHRAAELIFWELLTNAKKFHPSHTPKIEVVVNLAESEMVTVQVRDDGVRLSPQQLARIGTPYFQGEKYHTGETTGMGLGLSMVASLAWQVQGTSRVQNRREGPGVIVEISLPLMK